MATTTTIRLKAIRLSQKVRENPDLAKSLGIRVDFKEENNDQYKKTQTQKGCQA